MNEISRRKLLQFTTGALTTGIGCISTSEGLQVEQLAMPLETAGLAGEHNNLGTPASAPILSSTTVKAANDSYRLFSQTESRRSFGIVENFFDHIRDRADVKREILYWLTDGRSSFLGAASRFQFLEPVIRPMYEAAGILVELGFGLGVQESLFRNYSVSYAHAKGIWQMQWAGKKYGLRGGDYFDVVRSTEKQLEYLRDLVRDFAWNLELVMVDYNYGPGKKFSRYRSDPNAFQRIYNQIPQQTKRFVPRILAAIALGLEPERYGMVIPRLDIRTVEVPVFREIHHLELGLLLGTDHWNLGNLNPRENLRVWFKEGETVVVPQVFEESYYKGVNDHPLRDEFHQFVADVYPTPGENIRYVVKRGDNLAGIAHRFRECGAQSSQHIMLYNGLTSTIIHPGQELVIPCMK